MTIDTAQLLQAAGASLPSSEHCEQAYDALIQNLIACFKEEDTVAIPGFGSLVAEKKNERLATDPATGKRMLYPPSIRLEYQPSVLLRKKITG